MLQSLSEKIFTSALESVKPEKIVSSALVRNGDKLVCNRNTYTTNENVHTNTFNMNNNVYVIGYGKAVYGMFVGLYPLINDHMKKCLLSVPSGHTNDQYLQQYDDRVEIMEGAKNNLPDCDVIKSTKKIKMLVDSLSSEDILINLISGGGSALLSTPVDGITIENKLETIKLISRAGGDIKQLNTIRKHLSAVKGGKLLANCRSKQIFSLIISDIVGNCLDLIASGPTIVDDSTAFGCLEIFRLLRVTENVPVAVKKVLECDVSKSFYNDKIKCENILIGCNKLLTNKCVDITEKNGFKSYVLTTTLEADAETCGRVLANFAFALLSNYTTEKLIFELKELMLLKNDLRIEKTVSKTCFILAGETTVNVTGNGKGGRNQHMVLSFLAQMVKLSAADHKADLRRLCFLSAGSDGQDGPTDAAGAICPGELVEYALSKNIDIESFVKNCNSYNFFSNTELSSEFLIKTGLTGTNVMDIQLLIVN